jgi:hypothetical protein
LTLTVGRLARVTDKEKPKPDPAVEWAVYGIRRFQKFINHFDRTPLYKTWVRRGQAPFFFNYLYVGAWTVAVGLLAILTAVVPWALPFAALASFRLLGIFVWYVAMLLDSNHWLILSPGRNLIFLGLDGFTAAMVVGLWLAAARTTVVAEPTWSAALSTFMLNGAPSGFEGWPAAVATVVGTLSGLLLIAAGLAVLIALVGERLELGSPDDYHGPPEEPVRPTKKPWQP